MRPSVGLGVPLPETAVCVVDAAGEVVWRGECPSAPGAIAAIAGTKAPELVRAGLGTGPLSAWRAHGLRRLGVAVVCLDARHAKAALGMQVNKTDRNDALRLARIVARTGWYREVHVKSLDQQVVGRFEFAGQRS